MTVILEPIFDNFGYDPNVAPAWVMIPVKNQLPIWLVGGEMGLTATSTAPAVAEASIENTVDSSTPDRRVLQIKGKAVGTAFIDLRHGSKIVKRLEISVKPPVTLKLSFHFVSDSAKPINHSTTRTPIELGPMISWLNMIFTPQTNITFEKKNHFFLKFSEDLGDAVNFNRDAQGRIMKGHEWDKVIVKRDANAHINIFFVWRNELLTTNQKGKVIDAGGAIGYSFYGRDCLIEDWDGFMDRNNDGQADDSPVWENARMLAHELGHILGIADVGKTRKIKHPITRKTEETVVNGHYVMGSGPFIPKAHANIMHSIAKQIAGK